MVQAVRDGSSMRDVARAFGMSVSTVSLWCARALGQRLDRADFEGSKPGLATNRLADDAERRILSTRTLLKASVLGEYGAVAIRRALSESSPKDSAVPGRAAIHRVLVRNGAVDSARRQRRPPPPKGWYLPEVAQGRAELDSFDFIEDLKIAGGPIIDVLTATSLHGGLADAWPMLERTAQNTLLAVLQRWRQEGLPDYAQFDNATIFQGSHRASDSVGRVVRLCLALGITPVFAPPREPGFQNAIEGFNALWQAKAWRRHHVSDIEHLRQVSAAYIAAYRNRSACRIDAAPSRARFPEAFKLDLQAPLKGNAIYIRRTTETGQVTLLGRAFAVDSKWIRRLVRCEVDFSGHCINFYALRRSDPANHPLLKTTEYRRANSKFQGDPQVFDER
jgi:transposase-like protein